jgi:hypothetical protein
VKEPPFLVKIGIDIESKEERWFKKAGKASADGGSIALSLSRLFQSRFSVNRGEELHPRLPNQTYDYFICNGGYGNRKTAVSDESQKGKWQRLEALPPKVRLCGTCQKIRHKLDNPLPERVERELALLAKWDAKAGALQREKMMALYRQESQKRKR